VLYNKKIFHGRVCDIDIGNPKKQNSIEGGLQQWVERLTPNLSVASLNTIKGSRCFLEQETLLS